MLDQMINLGGAMKTGSQHSAGSMKLCCTGGDHSVNQLSLLPWLKLQLCCSPRTTLFNDYQENVYIYIYMFSVTIN